MTPPEISSVMGKRLRMRRTLLGMSQETVGNAIGVAAQQIQKYEKGTNVMSAVRLYEFSQLLKVPINYFYEDITHSIPLASLSESAGEQENSARTVTERETIEILKSFKRIKDHTVRKRFSDLLRSIAMKDL